MFLCNLCQEHLDESSLAYTLILEARLDHPAHDMFVLKFCSKSHVQEFLDRISNQRQRYVLTRKGRKGAPDKSFEANYPRELLLLVGSTLAS